MNKDSAPTIRDLYPHFNDKELAAAKENLERYLVLVLRIFERLEESHANPQVDQLTAGTGTLACTSLEPGSSSKPFPSI
jgi:hypothetical protein